MTFEIGDIVEMRVFEDPKEEPWWLRVTGIVLKRNNKTGKEEVCYKVTAVYKDDPRKEGIQGMYIEKKMMEKEGKLLPESIQLLYGQKV